MKLIGIDPGKTTGWCVVVNRAGSAPYPIASGEVKFDEGIKALLYILINHRPDAAVIESVIKTGQMNNDKHVQIQAFERAMVACELARPTNVETHVQVPEITKKCPVEVPKEVTGGHARDAYRVAAAFLLRDKTAK